MRKGRKIRIGSLTYRILAVCRSAADVFVKCHQFGGTYLIHKGRYIIVQAV